MGLFISRKFSPLGYYDFDKYERKSQFGGYRYAVIRIKAVDFLERNDIRGNFSMISTPGAYLWWDGVSPDQGLLSMAGPKFTEENSSRDTGRYGKKDDGALFAEAISKHHITGPLLKFSIASTFPEKSCKYFYTNPGWAVVYFDYDAVIFLRARAEPKYIDQFAIDLTQWQPIQTGHLQSLGQSTNRPFPNYFRAFSLESLDLDEQALAESAGGRQKIAPGYSEIHALMGKTYSKRKQYDEDLCALSGWQRSARHDNRRRGIILLYAILIWAKYEGRSKQYLRIIESFGRRTPKGYFLLAKTLREGPTI